MSTIKSPRVLTNLALQNLYMLGAIALVAGMITGTIAAFNIVAEDPLTGGQSFSGVAAAFELLGFWLAGVGLLASLEGPSLRRSIGRS